MRYWQDSKVFYRRCNMLVTIKLPSWPIGLMRRLMGYRWGTTKKMTADTNISKDLRTFICIEHQCGYVQIPRCRVFWMKESIHEIVSFLIIVYSAEAAHTGQQDWIESKNKLSYAANNANKSPLHRCESNPPMILGICD